MRIAKPHLIAFGFLCAAIGWWLSNGDSAETPTAHADATSEAKAGILAEPNGFATDGQIRSLPPARQVPASQIIHDGNVPQASTVVPSMLAAAALGAVPFTVDTVEQTEGDTYSWSASRSGTVIRLINSSEVTIKGKGEENKDVDIQPVDKINVADVVGEKWSKIITFKELGRHDLTITAGGVTRNLTLITPTSDDLQLRQPEINLVSNNKYTDPASTKDVNIYRGYLKLTGFRVTEGTQLQFAVFDESKSFVTLVDPSRPVIPRQDGTWEAELDMSLPQFKASERGFLVALSSSRVATHRYSDFADAAQVKFTVGTSDNPLEVPSQPVIKIANDATKTAPTSDNDYLSRERTFLVTGTITTSDAVLPDSRVVVFLNGAAVTGVATTGTKPNFTWEAKVTVDNDTSYTIEADTLLGRDAFGKRSDPVTVRVDRKGPTVSQVTPTTSNLTEITVKFDEPVDIVDPAGSPRTGATLTKAAFVLKGNSKGATAIDTATGHKISGSTVTISYSEVPPEFYTFTVVKEYIKDKFGNPMAADFETNLFRQVGDESPTISRGITGPTGPNVEFPEYTKPRDFINGFNPSDRVESRVSRLYYFRDAHRVAQIINRDAKSYNRAAVDMQQQLADKARTIADQATDQRREKERKAIEKAKKTREAERELQEAEANAARAANQAAQAAGAQQQFGQAAANRPPDRTDQEQIRLEQGAKTAQDALAAFERVAEAERRDAEEAANKVQALREDESRATEEWQSAIAVEDRAREDQFRREVAAAQADPDTYAPGKPTSQDPVQQTSVSVIGEGLIQLRGPIKGINVIRTMINQIDAPVGQVRVSVHTVQINGEKGDRMEVVAGKIQRYIDHSRFLTLQSAEMFRKAIVQVAAQRAMQFGDAPGMTQEDRDRSYLYSFFGEDFIRELEAMDSEFLHTGNKLLSIHSMDATSLASAMFIMALANNSTRMQILETFEGMMQTELPMAEQNYFEAGYTSDGKQKLFSKNCKQEDFQLLSHNARFQSIRGMFNADIVGDATMTPIQREFVRLAQIFKSRLIVEMELKQRVMERSVIEERLGDRLADLKAAKAKEEAAMALVEQARKDSVETKRTVMTEVKGLVSRVRQSYDNAISVMAPAGHLSELAKEIRKRELERASRGGAIGPREPISYQDYVIEYDLSKDNKHVTITQVTKSGRQIEDPQIWASDEYKRAVEKVNRLIEDELGLYRYENMLHLFKEAKRTVGRLKDEITDDHPPLSIADLDELGRAAKNVEEIVKEIGKETLVLDRAVNGLLAELTRSETDNLDSFEQWTKLSQKLRRIIWPQSQKGKEMLAIVKEVDDAFQSLLESEFKTRDALKEAGESRRPLDHKKFLDMLVDEMEDKYIELLEGTRAHTANIDAYIKRLMTSLDDDFNTQFYNPTFRKVREASQLWDVQMGQVETTNVLANNREFAKVSPEASMEFDLPKRDIVIAEAMNGAKAMMNDFGALAQDPTFLAMAQLGSGSPTSTQAGGASGGNSTVRNVLPGLSTDTAESVMSQQGPGGQKFGAAMESLIPDPAIYKFETGTGWEIRPVIQPDGQAVVFDFNYMYSTDVREPVRADEKHLGRVKRHYVNTDVQLSNFELREISRYTVALKASRTSRGVPLFEDIPLVGVLFRPQPSDESSLQQNVILGQSTIFPTLFDLMGLRWAPVVADLDPLRLSNDEFIVRNRRRALMNRVFDQSSSQVDEFLRIPQGERRMDLYRSQETIPSIHPDGYEGPGANFRDSQLREGYDPTYRPESRFVPSESTEGSPLLRSRRRRVETMYEVPLIQPEASRGNFDSSSNRSPTRSQNGVANVEYRSRAGDPRYPGQQAEFVTKRPSGTEPRPASRMERLPTLDRAARRLPGQIMRPISR